MVNYNDPDQIDRLTNYRNAQALVLTGLFFWEVLVTSPFDYSIITRKRGFKWPMIFYFTSRAAVGLHILSIVVNSQGKEIVPCDTQVWILKITDAIAIWSSSILLILRTLAVWSSDRRAMIVLGVGASGLIVVYCLTWQQSINKFNGKGCVVLQSVANRILLTEFTYSHHVRKLFSRTYPSLGKLTFISPLLICRVVSRCFDLFITGMTIVKLWSWRGQGGISRLLLENGVAYFVFATTGNLVQAVLPALNLSGLMNVIFLPVAMMISVIASTRVYIRLLTHDDMRSGSGGYTNNTTSFNARTRATDQTGAAGVPTFPAAPGFDQPYGLSAIKNPNRHRITIQTQTDVGVMDDKGADLEYGSNPHHGKVNEDQDIYHMRGPKVL